MNVLLQQGERITQGQTVKRHKPKIKKNTKPEALFIYVIIEPGCGTVKMAELLRKTKTKQKQANKNTILRYLENWHILKSFKLSF